MMPSTFVCVYRHFFPPAKAIATTASTDDVLARFVEDYVGGNSYYDWGDDPSFFSALKIQGNHSCAGWGVCRPNVRRLLSPGDIVIFFCAKREAPKKRTTEYFFIGVATVAETLLDRQSIWTKLKYRPYRKHYNVLAKYSNGQPVQHETFHPYHDDWLHRVASPYIIFDSRHSRFELQKPLWVGSSSDGKREVWRSDQSARVARLEQLLFISLGIERRLRTSPVRTAHPHINLTRRLQASGGNAHELRERLLRIV